jgi:predicted nucleic acid-binding protein
VVCAAGAVRGGHRQIYRFLRESAAISLAHELRADGVVIDEKLGRRSATERGLRVVGTIGVLEAAAERGLIDLGDAFEKVKKTDCWVSPKFLDERLA